MSSSSHSSRPKENTAAVQQDQSELSAIPIKQETDIRIEEDDSELDDEDDGGIECSSYSVADEPDDDFDDSPIRNGPRSQNQTLVTSSR